MRSPSKTLIVLLGAGFFCALIAVAVAVWLWPRPDPETPPSARLSTPQGRVRSLAYSPNGLHLAVATGDEVVIYDRAAGQPVQTLTGRRKDVYVTALAYSPDGRLLVSAAANGDLTVWDAEWLVLRQTFQEGRANFGQNRPNSEDFTCVSFSPDGRTIAVGALDRGVGLWDVATGRQVQFTQHPEPVYALAFSPDGRVLATGGERGSLQFQDTTTWAITRKSHELQTAILALAYSPEGDLACGRLSSAEADPVMLWERKTGRFRAIPSGEPGGWTVRAAHLAFSPDGRTIAVAESTKNFKCRNRIRLYDVPSGNLTETIVCPEQVNAVAFSPDGREIAAGCGYDTPNVPKNPHNVLIWARPFGVDR